MKYKKPIPYIFILAVQSILLSTKVTVDAASNSDAQAQAHNNNESPPIYCSVGYNGEIVQIPPEQINDGYCDCPANGGIDELQTGACAGSTIGGWVGLDMTTKTTDSNPNNDDKEEDSYFQCGDEQDLQIPASRVRDGICDCCDGSDESTIVLKPNQSELYPKCPNICYELFAVERAAKEELMKSFTIGSAQRQKDLNEFDVMYSTSQTKMSEIQDVHLPEAKNQLEMLRTEINDLIMDSYYDWTALVLCFVSGLQETPNPTNDPPTRHNSTMMIPAGNALTLETFITSICQLSGELNDSMKQQQHWVNGEDTCIPLRLAAMGLGIAWSKEEEHQVQKEESTITTTTATAQIGGCGEDFELGLFIADIMKRNFNQKEDSTTGRKLAMSIGLDDVKDEDKLPRRLRNNHAKNEMEEYYFDDDDIYDDDDDNHLRNGILDEGGKYDTSQDYDQFTKLVKDIVDDSNDESIQNQALPFEVFRAPFLKQANAILFKIDNILQEDENNNDEEEIKDEDEMPEESLNDTVDPMALQMVRNTLSLRIRHIQRGVSYGKSSQTLLTALKREMVFNSHDDDNDRDHENLMLDYMDTLTDLAVMTFFYSQLDTVEMMNIIASMNDVGDIEDEETCVSLNSLICPVEQMELETVWERTVSFPHDDLMRSAMERCEVLENNENVCNTKNDDNNDVDLPKNIPDGYFEYFVPKARDLTRDVYSKEFYWKLNERPYSVDVHELEESKSTLTTEISSLKNELEEIRNEIGGNGDGMKYGPDGELYAVRNACFDITAGKYTYEVCPFGGAHQREGSAKKGGTSLGKWSGMEVDDKTGERVLKWTGGEKCWNGPRRSATVFMTCGANTRLLSADEPNICEYEFAMESSIACDEAFRKKHKL